MAALVDPFLFAASLRQGAARADAHGLLPMVATLAWAHAQRRQDEALGAVASLYLSVAAALDGDLDTAEYRLREARAADPTQRDGWLAVLADLIGTHPTLAPLIRMLLTPQPPADDTVPANHAGTEPEHDHEESI